MKQLKFMIAATAAIGLAGVAQAAFPTTAQDADSNTGFEEYSAGTAVPTSTDSYFRYTGNNPEDNESKIIAGAATLADGVEKSGRAKGTKFNANANVLEVNTGTDPLLRTINIAEEGEDLAPVTVPAETGIYIDTLVQFTVTPDGDTVTPTADDKLMIYLQEVLDNTETTDVDEAATNLVVVAGRSDDGQALVRETYTVNNVAVEPNKWYRLRVKAFDSVYTDSSAVLPAFTIEVDGTVCTFDKPSCGQTALAMILGAGKAEIQTILAGGQSLVFSLIAEKTLKAVGFAGEGKVDDIVFSTTLDPIVDTIDFTLAWGDGITAVQYAINGSDQKVTAKNNEGFEVNPGDQITVYVTTAPWFAYNGSQTFTAGSTDQTEELAATPLAQADGSNNVVVNEATKPADLGINGGSFYAATASKEVAAELSKALTWAMKKGKAATSTAAAGIVSALNFEDETETDPEKAYLLNCEETQIDTAKAAFKVSAFSVVLDENGVPQVTAPTTTSWYDGTTYWDFNGKPVIKGAAALNGAYGGIDANSKFFKAVLTK